MTPPPIAGRVSVVIPCYNAAAFIRRAVESVLAQTYPDVELVLVDDCSSDDLPAALQDYAGRLTLSRNPANVGTSASRNNGAALATGAMLAFLDQDDWWPPGLLTRLVPACAPGTAACYDNYVLREADIAQGEAVWRARPTVLEQAQPWNSACVNWATMNVMFQGAPMLKLLVHRQDFMRAGGYDARFYGVEDFHFEMKLLASRTCLEIVPDAKGYYLDHAGSTSAFIKTDESKQARACAVWLLMCRAMPRELSLSPDALASCRRGQQYWAMRSADLLLRGCLRQRQFARLLSLAVLRAVLPVLPALVRHKGSGAARKVGARLGPNPRSPCRVPRETKRL